MPDQFPDQVRLQCEQFLESDVAYAVANLVGAAIVEGVQDRLSLFDTLGRQRVGYENETIAVELLELFLSLCGV